MKTKPIDKPQALNAPVAGTFARTSCKNIILLAVLAAAVTTLMNVSQAADPPAPVQAAPAAATKPTSYTELEIFAKNFPFAGEPYELLGKRLVFTSWFYVHSGWDPGWQTPSGEVGMAGTAGLFDAHFAHNSHAARGVRIRAQPAAKLLGPMVKPEKPWESAWIAFVTVIRDGGRYRAWGKTKAGGQSYRVYFESEDGLHWTRPELGLIDFEGNRRNNLVHMAGAIFIDPSAPPAERYKMLDMHGPQPQELIDAVTRWSDLWRGHHLVPKPGSDMALAGYTSADGINWSGGKPIMYARCDSDNGCYYDPKLKRYVIFTRYRTADAWSMSIKSEYRMSGGGRRAIARSESPSFGDFPPPKVVLEATPDMLPTDQLYYNCYTSIPGAPDHHLMFPAIWDVLTDVTRIGIAASHDGRLWHFLPGSPVFETPTFGEWNGGCVFPVRNLIEAPNGDFLLYFHGFNVPHKYPRKGAYALLPGCAVWPKGRLVAIEAPEVGEFVTVGIVPPGRKLRINAVTMRSGSIRIGVEDTITFQPVRKLETCTPIVGDQFRTVVRWGDQEDLGFEEGQSIRLRFQMNQAKIFGLEFE